MNHLIPVAVWLHELGVPGSLNTMLGILSAVQMTIIVVLGLAACRLIERPR